MLKIKNLHLHNFIKYEDQTLDLDNMGLVLLNGLNLDEPVKGKSAAGKSLIGGALHWLMSGVMPNLVKADGVIGDFGKSAFVGVDIEANGVDYKVTRYRKDKKYSNSLHIIQGEDISHRNVDETEERLYSVLGCSFELFRLSCFYDGDFRYHFSRMNAQMRGKILDEICGTSEANIPFRYKTINGLINNSEESIRSNQNEMEIYKNKIESSKSIIESAKNNINSMAQIIDSRLNSIKEEIDKIKIEKIDGMKEQLEDIDKKLMDIIMIKKKLSAIEDQILCIDRKIGDCKISIQNENKNMNSILNKKQSEEGVCEYCGNEVTKVSQVKLNTIRKGEAKICELNIQSYSGQILELNKEKEKLVVTKNKLDEIINDELNLNRDKYSLEFKIKTSQTNLKTKNEKIQEYENVLKEKEDLVNGINSTIQETITKEKSNIENYNNIIGKNKYSIYRKQYELDILRVLSDFYSQNGFRPLVMSHYSPILSEAANYFLHNLTGGTQSINVSSKTQLASGEVRDKIDIEVLERGVTKSFPEQFSCGEGQAIDIAMNLGVMRLASMRASKQFGFYWMDEITNGLSDSLIRQLISVVREYLLKEGMTIIMTTHHPLPYELFDHVWTAVKEKGKCRIEEEK